MTDRQPEDAPLPGEPARERIARRLHEAVERLRVDMEQVEFWTEVLGCLTRDVPDYDSDTNVLNRFKLPSRGRNVPERVSDFGSDESSDDDEIFPQDRAPNTTRSRH